MTKPIETAISVSTMCCTQRRPQHRAPVARDPARCRTAGSRARRRTTTRRRRSWGSPGPAANGITARTPLGCELRDRRGPAVRRAARASTIPASSPLLVGDRRRDRRRAARSADSASRTVVVTGDGPLRPVAVRATSSSTSSSVASPSRLSARSAPTNSATKSSAGSVRIASGLSYCASCPPCRRIAILSPILIASSMSCVTNTTVLRTRAWRPRNSSCSRARLIGSIAPNGSSISISGGSAASARATPTRWRWPPESWAG